VVAIDPRYYRPTEVDLLLGDPTKAREAFGWTPEISLAEMIGEMVRHDLAEAEQEMMMRAG
jgi:GDPmannose 4,6-dehydratase